MRAVGELLFGRSRRRALHWSWLLAAIRSSAAQKAARISPAAQALGSISWQYHRSRAGGRLPGIAGGEAVAEEAGMHIGHQRPVVLAQRPQRPVELDQQLQRRWPGRQAEAAGVPAAVARVIDGGDQDRRLRPIRARKLARTSRPLSTTVLIARPGGGSVAVGGQRYRILPGRPSRVTWKP
jgi:hypothetical protein